ncbi:hypothetical protein GII30_19715 [Gordonia amarae]|uniref:Uncharacterized protein n=2 Tax=Gordonia amarae TaxID=36821 RepID=G7GPZ9_9ACTN|nr:hypothetical protein [Gordonia amarae]MCS3880668.1 hypothetical protein [Gordonia amarae]QHN18966.1 hypothetical protein GII35_20070 [Gordonia amarae]QHN23441.1 hypothetical protein GII34_19570 [Gordonia amarae]QHN32341.1 hypothetical protein GII32_19885 [Gordonia amarae]QHN41089.1 hypothetical protein GII30_19715 [Gordonia amarae]
MDSIDVRALLDRWAAPFLLVCGLLLVSLTMAPWGVGDEGVRPTVTGLGRVTVEGASAADVAFLEEHTQRPGLPLLLAGAVVVATAAAMWWRDILIWPRSLVLAIAFAAAAVRTIRVIADPAPLVFDSLVTRELESQLPTMSAGWGVYGALVVCVVALIVAVAHLALRAVDRRTARATTSPD